MPVAVKVGDLGTIARMYVQKCAERERPPKVADLARILKISRDYLNKLFTKSLHITATEFLNRERIEIAQRLLRDSNVSVTNVACQSGFKTRRTFHRAFVRITGMTPAAYRRKSAKRP